MGGGNGTRGGRGVKVGTLYLWLPPGGSVEGATAALTTTTTASASAGGEEEEEVEVPVSVLAENKDRERTGGPFLVEGASGGRGLHLLAAAADLRAALEGRGAAAEVSKLAVLLRGVREEEKEVEDGWILL